MSSQHILLLTPGRPVLYTTTRALFPVLLPTSPTAGDVCKEFKKTGQFVSDLQICCHFTTQNSKTDIKTNGETNTFPICFFVLSEQLVLSLTPHTDTIFEEIVGAETSTFRKSKNLFCRVMWTLVHNVVRLSVFFVFGQFIQIFRGNGQTLYQS